MDFAINYSPAAAKLIRDNQIELDYFKTPPWPDMIAQAEQLRPVRVHFNLRTGDPGLAQTDWGQIEKDLQATATCFINIHLGVQVQEMPEIQADGPVSSGDREAVVEQMLNDVQMVCAHFGRERVIAENVPYRVAQGRHLRACVEPPVISQVIEAAGCGLLLDVAHARIAADAIGMDAKDYIQALPVHRLAELHFTGLHDWDGFLMDHLPLLEADWPWLDWILEQNGQADWGKAGMLAFEYGGTGEFFSRFSDPDMILQQVPRLYAACHSK